MAAVQEQSVYTYATSSGGQTYRYDIVVDTQGLVSVRNIRSPLGLVTDPYTSLPQMVIQDINEARDQVAQRNAVSEVDSGTVTFAGEVSLPVGIAPGVVNNTNYRVVYTTPDGMHLTTTGKTITGFTVEAPSAYGTVAVPKVVDYSVITTTASVSNYGGTATIDDTGSVSIVFPVAMATASYRVVLSPDGPFGVFVTGKTKQGFTLQVGYTMIPGSTVTVGFDVFL